MKIVVQPYGEHSWSADFTDLPGAPVCGRGETPEAAVANLFLCHGENDPAPESKPDEVKRIYVVVAETVEGPNGPVVQPCGRIAAQVGHVVSKMRVLENNRHIVENVHGKGSRRKVLNIASAPVQPFTTIVLAARDAREMIHIVQLLAYNGVDHATFIDDNPEYAGGQQMTAICTYPVDRYKVSGITDYLPLWSHGKNTLEITQ